ncbi:molybdenum cofactor guanylyltransferase [Natronolimnobius baerhuensis]|uniref:Probable molybdenum cofactor guanylyltransferase n=1 Tax=Natronolimnobius baerhuensis TaxID=253108 RepID=A0A202EBR4_9EURY|nr:molybdenum cofactor guanylyltransferase [Natronolimnobius baerhuensis]OVE85657.1 molybdenum cofactor guanylyltransferase [Natronolimnobius baerhuensis]
MTTRSTSLAGLVIAGGYSTRFGEADKAVADLAGTPMSRRVVDRLAAVTDSVVINCREDQRSALQDALRECDLEIRFATDPIDDQGPVAGIQTGLEALDREYAAVVACDMPFVDPALFEVLLERAREHGSDGADAAVVQLEDGWYQTTQALYRTDSMAQACGETLAADDRRILAALERLEYVTIDEPTLERAGIDVQTFESIDTQDALEAAAVRLE